MSIRVTARVWDQSRQRNSRLLLLLALADFAHDSGVCWEQGLTLATVARKARVNERQGRNLLAQIAAEGELYAPPVAGRGHTNRYFVVVGLDETAIAATLMREFGHEQASAQAIAHDLLQRQQATEGATDATAEGDDAPTHAPASVSICSQQARGRSGEKGRSPAPFHIAKRGNLAPEKGQSSAEKGQSSAEKGQSSTRKGAIQRRVSIDARAPERGKTPLTAADPMIRTDPSHDPPPPAHNEEREEEGVTQTEALLLKTGLYPSTARALRDLPFPAVDAYVRKRRLQGWNAGAIKQGLEREQDQLCEQVPSSQQRASVATDWQSQALAICPTNTTPDDVQWVAALLSEGSPAAEAQTFLARRIARRANAVGGSYVAA